MPIVPPVLDASGPLLVYVNVLPEVVATANEPLKLASLTPLTVNVRPFRSNGIPVEVVTVTVFPLRTTLLIGNDVFRYPPVLAPFVSPTTLVFAPAYQSCVAVGEPTTGNTWRSPFTVSTVCSRP